MTPDHRLLYAVVVAVTLLGSPSFLMGVILAVYWCRKRVTGLRVGAIWLVSMWLNSALKILFHLPRPGTQSPGGLCALVEVEGYGFPSGHTMGTATMWWALAWGIGNVRLYYGAVMSTIIVGASRLYLGAHYPADVVGGGALGIVVAALGAWVISWWEGHGYRPRPAFVVTMAALASVGMMSGPLDEFVSKSAGFFLGFVSGGAVEPALGGVSRGAPPGVQVLKVAAGAALVFGASYIMKGILPATVAGTFLRYAVMGVAATLGAPALFRILRLSGNG